MDVCLLMLLFVDTGLINMGGFDEKKYGFSGDGWGVWWLLSKCVQILGIIHIIQSAWLHISTSTEPYLWVYETVLYWKDLSIIENKPNKIQWFICKGLPFQSNLGTARLHMCEETVLGWFHRDLKCPQIINSFWINICTLPLKLERQLCFSWLMLPTLKTLAILEWLAMKHLTAKSWVR